jgi:hypothetical protein
MRVYEHRRDAGELVSETSLLASSPKRTITASQQLNYDEMANMIAQGSDKTSQDYCRSPNCRLGERKQAKSLTI